MDDFLSEKTQLKLNTTRSQLVNPHYFDTLINTTSTKNH